MAEHPLIVTIFQSLWDLATYYFLYPVLLGFNVSQAQHGSQRLAQTQGLYLESVALRNRKIHILMPNVVLYANSFMRMNGKLCKQPKSW